MRKLVLVSLASLWVFGVAGSAWALTATPSPTPTPTPTTQLTDISFLALPPISVAQNPEFLAVADFNGDGRPDLVASSPTARKVTILLTDATGNVASGISAGPLGSARASLRQVATGDLDGDGIPDVAVVDYVDNDVFILLGNGDGTLQSPSTVVTGKAPYGVVIGQFDGQPGNDLAVSNSKDNNVSVFFNRNTGQASFTAPINYGVGNLPQLLISNDFDGAGALDIVAVNTGNSGAHDVTELVGDGGGNFQARGNFLFGPNSHETTVGDFNHDGFPDIATANGLLGTKYAASTSAFTVLLSDPLGQPFAKTLTHAIDCAVTGSQICQPIAIAAGDFDRDGNTDLAVAVAFGALKGATGTFSNVVLIFKGNGDGTFDEVGQPITIPGGPKFMVAADFDRDGRIDLAVAAGSFVQVLHNTGQFPPTPTPTQPQQTPRATATGPVPPPGTPGSQGEFCTSPYACVTGLFCVDGRCCNTICNGPNDHCDLGDPGPGICAQATVTPTPTETVPVAPAGGGVTVSRSGGCSTGGTSGSPLGQLTVVLVPAALWLGRRRIRARVATRTR